MSTPYWLYNWLDAHGVDSLEGARQALSVPSQLEDLHDMAVLAKELLPASVQGQNVILAGRGLDLSTQLHCPHRSCREHQVDELFRKAWHYFDSIVVDDAVSHLVTEHWKNVATDPRAILSEIEVLLYLRKIHAEDLVEFRQKPNTFGIRWRSRAEQTGLGSAVKVADGLLPQLASDADITIQPLGKGTSKYSFQHPKFEIVCTGEIKFGGVSGKPTRVARLAVARQVLRQYFPHLITDITAAVSLGIPLGCANWFHSQILSASEPKTPSTLAFNFSLPILQGIPVKTLIKIRHDEQESFQRFRDALRLAMKERIKNDESINAIQICEQIRADLIDPELRNIRDRLKSAERALSKKSVAGVFLGALVTSCGILAGLPIPISIAAGIGTAGSTESGAVAKFIDGKQQVRLSDMYFLWKAVEHSDHGI